MSVVMLPPHRPAVASTSNPSQCQYASPNSSSQSLNPPIISPSIRKTTNQDVRISVTRHQDKLELIRNSLRPFAQNSTSDSQNSSTYNDLNSEDETRRQIMLNTLTQIGFERTAASLALEFVQHSSVAAAAEFLLNINKDHKVFKQDAHKVFSPTHQHIAPSPAMYGCDMLKYSSKNSLCPITVEASQLGISSLEMSKTQQIRMLQTVKPAENLFKFDDNFIKPQPSSCNNNAIHSARSPSPVSPIPSTISINYQRSHAHFKQNAINKNLDGCMRPNALKSPPLLSPEMLSNRIPTDRQTTNVHTVISIEKEVRQRSQKLLKPMHSVPVEGVNRKTINYLRRGDASPILKTHIEQPQNTILQIKLDANANGAPENSENQWKNKHHMSIYKNYAGEALLKVYETTGMAGVKNIIVDPDITSDNYSHYKQINIQSSKDTDSFTSVTDDSVTVDDLQDASSSSTVSIMDNISRIEDEVEPVRCSSPLPEGIQKKIENCSYISAIKPCCARLFRFYMEQHAERLIQLYQERTRRFIQLQKEMEYAKLPEEMRKQMLIFLNKKESRYLRLKRQKMNKDMFEIVKHIGFGAFGRVSLVRKKDTGKAYAMKTLRKREIIVKQQAAHVKAERDILAEANSQWIVKLYFSFQDERNLYFIMEYVPGGDMMQLLIAKGTFPESLARFYIAELTCAIEYVHNLGFIHRDIKPDNILIDQNGHIKLTDFGLCTGLRWTHDKRFYVPCSNEENTKQHQALDEMIMASLDEFTAESENNLKVLDLRNHIKRSRSHSLVGTDNYMAPEVICCMGHSQLCDWWSVGVILYEMVFGRPPFLSNDRFQTQFKIVNWRQFLDLSNGPSLKLSPECIHIIKRLCSDENIRLGCNRGAEDVKRHSWLKDINFSLLRSITPEYIPRVDHAEDTSNFDTFDIEATNKSIDRRKCSDINPAFYEFTFRHFFDYDGQGCPSLRQSPYKSFPKLSEKFQKCSSIENDNSERNVTTDMKSSIEKEKALRSPNGPEHIENYTEGTRKYTGLDSYICDDESEIDSQSDDLDLAQNKSVFKEEVKKKYVNGTDSDLSKVTAVKLENNKDSKKEGLVGQSLNKLKLNFVRQNKESKENSRIPHKTPARIARPDRLFPEIPKLSKLVLKHSVLRRRANIFQSNESLNI